MNRVAITCVWLLAFTALAPSRRSVSVTPGTIFGGGGGGGGGVDFSDNFNRSSSDSMGANWTEDLADTDIVSDTRAALETASYSRIVCRYSGQNTDTANQYLKLTFPVFVSDNYPDVLLRMNGSGNPHYGIQFQVTENQVVWYKYDSSTDTTSDTIASSALTVDQTDTFGVTLTGTGNDTVIRIWRNPTGLPVDATDWNGDTTPDVSFTTDPGANAVDSGNQLGFGGQIGAAQQVQIDDFFGGDL